MRHPSGTQGQSSGFREEATATDAREAHARAAASKLKLVSPPLPRFRPLVAADQDGLWHWLHVALWDPPAAPLRPVEILQSPAVRIYAEGWGRETDCGVVAVVDGVDAGACWMRVVPLARG